VASLSHRYAAGQREEVWSEIRELGPVPSRLTADVDAVATETMRRVNRHVQRLATAYVELGLVPSGGGGRDVADQVRIRPTADDPADLARLSRKIGGIPAALRACLTEVGAVALYGDCPALGLYYDQRPTPSGAETVFPDPLATPNVDLLRMDWDDSRTDPARWWTRLGRLPGQKFPFAFAPDDLHKANYSGATQDVLLPDRRADPVLHGAGGRDGITLVEYLRLSIIWGGCPGWSLSTAAPPRALQPLMTSPDF
jgi:hypothetical protein